jgi:hypothetical protein
LLGNGNQRAEFHALGRGDYLRLFARGFHGVFKRSVILSGLVG